MTEPGTPHLDVHVGDVSQSQLVFGDHNTIQTPEGTKVTVLQVGERPAPRLRSMPVSRRPAVGTGIVGRDEELRLTASAAPDQPVELYAPDGAGKTSVLKFVAQGMATPPEGVVFEPVRRRTLDEIQAKLYAAFWESDVPFLPSPAEVGGFLADREALLIFDDCGLDRDDLEILLAGTPRCTVVIASGERTLWSRGAARALKGLDTAAAVELLERELGHAIGGEERPAAEELVARLDGYPQALVETAALVTDGRASLRELAGDAETVARGADPSLLSSSQRRILEVLAATGGAPLGSEHVSTLANVPDAGRGLQELERRGWVKSASPRYRLMRPLPEGVAGHSGADVANRLLGHLTTWSKEASPSAVTDEADAVEGALELGAADRHRRAALALALAAEGKLAVAGSWTSWRNVLTSGLEITRALGDETAHAHLLHQLGSRSLCLGADELAVGQLEEALAIRERIGDHAGAELTRHNLSQIGGGGPGHGGGEGGDGGGPWRPRFGVALAALGAVVAAVVAVVLATSGGEGTNAVPAGGTAQPERSATEAPLAGTSTRPAPNRPPSKPQPTVSKPQPTDSKPPSIEIVSPADDGSFRLGSRQTAVYSCTDEEGGSGVASCVGPVPNQEPIDTSTEGPQTFTVTARDKAGNAARRTVAYSVFVLR